MDEPILNKHSPLCPFCGCNKMYRSRRHGLHEWFLHYFRSTSPYRCEDCDGRFLRSRLLRANHKGLGHPPNKHLHHHPA